MFFQYFILCFSSDLFCIFRIVYHVLKLFSGKFPAGQQYQAHPYKKSHRSLYCQIFRPQGTLCKSLLRKPMILHGDIFFNSGFIHKRHRYFRSLSGQSLLAAVVSVKDLPDLPLRHLLPPLRPVPAPASECDSIPHYCSLALSSA